MASAFTSTNCWPDEGTENRAGNRRRSGIGVEMDGLGAEALCPCGTGLDFGLCCEPVLLDPSTALVPDALMRSRYTAFALGDVAHLRRTWCPSTCPTNIRINPDQRWIGLKVVRSSVGGEVDGAVNGDAGEVEFVARSRIGGKAQSLHEVSRFRRSADGWLYVTGARRDRNAD
jgi:SEC-C motif-containing protein